MGKLIDTLEESLGKIVNALITIVLCKDNLKRICCGRFVRRRREVEKSRKVTTSMAHLLQRVFL